MIRGDNVKKTLDYDNRVEKITVPEH